MKNIITILAAATTAALCITSCNKEAFDDSPSISNELTVDIAVAGPEGAETKAVKSSWVAGDKLNIWFDGTSWKQLPQLVLTYDGARWNASEMDASILKSAGKFNVIYEASNSEFTTIRNNNYYYFPSQNVVVSGSTAQKFYSVPMSCYQNAVAYTYSDGKLSANIASWNFLTQLQVVITGLEKAASNYVLKINGVENTAAYYLNTSTGDFKSSGYSSGGYSVGVPNEEGVAFYFGTNTQKIIRDVVFTLKERLSSKEYTFTKSSYALATQSTKVKAIKFNASNFEGLPVAVDLGLSVKWASMNVGASKPEDYGYYFAWGETTEKTYYGWAKEGDYKWGVFDINATNYGMAKYTAYVKGGDGLKTLQPGDDAATVNWGTKWRTPTLDEINELFDETKCEWTWDSERKGYTVKSLKNSNSIFFPLAGYHFQDKYVSGYGCYWSSSLYNERVASSNYISLSPTQFRAHHVDRLRGFTVRAVTE